MTSNTVTISQRGIEKIVRHAYDSYPEECCGLMFSVKTRNDGMFIDTSEGMIKEETTADHYSMDPFELTEKEKTFSTRGYEISGFYHSHPDSSASLSREDEEFMIPGMIYLIVSLMHGRCSGFSAWMKESSYTEPIRLEIREKV